MYYIVKSLMLLSCSLLLTSAELVGHLQPFGNHRLPTVMIDEFTKENAPGPQDFFQNYLKPSKAAIFRGAADGSKAFNLWSDEYIREHYGENEVRLEGKKEKRHFPPVGEKYLGRDTLRHFVDTYHEESSIAYIVSDLPRAMYQDVDVLPSVGACGEMAKRIVEVDIWWSGGGSYSIIHKDAFNQINCLLNGTKYWKLIENKYEKQLYQQEERVEGYGGFSKVKPSRVDLKKFPMVKDIEWSNLTLNAGDCLFLPKSYYHQVASTGPNNLAVSLLMSRFDGRDDLDFSDCTEHTDYKTPRTLDKYDVQLVWNGTGTMVMGRLDLEDGIRDEFLSMTAEAQKDGIPVDFETWSSGLGSYEEDDTFRMGDLKTVFNIMDKDQDGYLTTSEIENLSLKDLQAISNEYEIYEPSNHYNFEYSIMAFDGVWKLLKKVKSEIKVLSPARWEKLYTSKGGTKEFANEIFTKLAKGKDDIFMHEVQPIDMWNALENWVKYWVPQYSSLNERPTKDAFEVFDDYGHMYYDEL